MIGVDGFTSTVILRLQKEVTALHSGDVGPRMALWSHNEPVTLFGAELTSHGWAEIEPMFQQLAASFTGSQSCEYEVLAAGASGDLGYVVAIERSVAASSGGEVARFALRVTTVFRREDDEWKVVHRHGDPYDESARNALARRAAAHAIRSEPAPDSAASSG
jgi:ketosteroid isomerase-like protein